MTTQIDTGTVVEGLLRDASLDRLVCLLRHWTCADEAMARFDRELATGWDYDDDPMTDHSFGAYYHWCALLCGFGEAALDHGLLSPLQLGPIREDIEAVCLASERANSSSSSSGFAGGASPYRGPAPRWRGTLSAAARSSGVR